MTPFIYTASGRRLNPLDPDPEQLDIKDIAHALACCNRFAGHCREPVSVAQHCVYASWLVAGGGPGVALQALLHDASEYVLGDVTKWLKQSPKFAAYRIAEARVQGLIYQRFGCHTETHPAVEAVDQLLVRFEMWKGWLTKEGDPGACTVGVLNPDAETKYPPPTPEEVTRIDSAAGFSWYPWSWLMAKQMFLGQYYTLTEQTDARNLP